MATSGKNNWEKYWKGKNGIITKTKKPSLFYETPVSNKPLGSLLINQEIIYNDSLSQHISLGGNAKIAFQVKKGDDEIYYSSVDNFQKPGINAGIGLSPKSFGLENQTFSPYEYYERVINSINQRWENSNYSGELGDYLIELVKYANGLSANFSTIVLDSTTIREIERDFSEVIGPLICVKRNNILKGVDVSGAKIYIPSSGTFLYDYKLIKGYNEYLVSAKIGKGVANQIKPQFVINLIQDIIPENLKKSKAYKLLSELSKEYGQNSVKWGPFYGWKILQTNGEITDLCINNVVENYNRRTPTNKLITNVDIWRSFITKHMPNTKIDSITYGELRYKCEKLIESASQLGSLQNDLKKIFKLYLNTSKIIYLKTSINNQTKMPSFSTINVGGVENVNFVQLRSSNDSASRTSDRIGFDKIR